MPRGRVMQPSTFRKISERNRPGYWSYQTHDFKITVSNKENGEKSRERKKIPNIGNIWKKMEILSKSTIREMPNRKREYLC